MNNPTNEEILGLIQQFQEASGDEQVNVFQDIMPGEDGNFDIEIDTGFIEVFEKSYPKANLDECLQIFFEELFTRFMKEAEENPEIIDVIKGQSLEDIAE